jgi:hypothetical protein
LLLLLWRRRRRSSARRRPAPESVAVPEGVGVLCARVSRVRFCCCSRATPQPTRQKRRCCVAATAAAARRSRRLRSLSSPTHPRIPHLFGASCCPAGGGLARRLDALLARCLVLLLALCRLGPAALIVAVARRPRRLPRAGAAGGRPKLLGRGLIAGRARR